MDTNGGGGPSEQGYVIDPNFEPQSRDRANTFPLCRRENQESGDNAAVMKIEPTIGEESVADYLGGVDDRDQYDVRSYTNLSPSNRPDFVEMLIAQPSENNDMMSHHTPLQHTNSNSSFQGSRIDNDQSNNLVQQPSSSFIQTLNEQTGLQSHTNNLEPQPGPSNAATPATQKAKSSSRKNAWGSQSYADLITEAIESSPEKRLTLAQIYEYMVKNIEYFSDKGESNSSAGWKNSIRHNLSLHDKFKRIQNEGTGKSSWWTINYNAKPGKSPRRRVQSMDQSMAKTASKGAKMAAKRKQEKNKKSRQGGAYSGLNNSPPFPYSPNSSDRNDFSTQYRNRTHSNASSLNGHISPSRSRIPTGDGDDGRPLSPPDDSNFIFNSQHFSGYPINENFNEMIDSVEGIALQPDQFPPNMYGGPSTLSNSTNSIPNSFKNGNGTEEGFLSALGSMDQSSAGVNSAVNSSPNLANLLLAPGTSKTNPENTMMRGSRGNDTGNLQNQPHRARSNTMPGRPPASLKYSVPGNKSRQQTAGYSSFTQIPPTTKARHASATQASPSTPQQTGGGGNNLTSLLQERETSHQQQQRSLHHNRNNQQQPRHRGYSMGAKTGPARPSLHQIDSGMFGYQQQPSQSIKQEPINQYTQLENMRPDKDGNFSSFPTNSALNEDVSFSNLSTIQFPKAEMTALQQSMQQQQPNNLVDPSSLVDWSDTVNPQDMNDIHEMAFGHGGAMSVNDVLVKMETQDAQVVHNTAATDIYFNNPITTNSQPQQMNMDNSNLIQYCQPQQQPGTQQQIQQQQYFAEHHHVPSTYSHSFMLPQQTAMDSAYDYRSVT